MTIHTDWYMDTGAYLRGFIEVFKALLQSEANKSVTSPGRDLWCVLLADVRGLTHTSKIENHGSESFVDLHSVAMGIAGRETVDIRRVLPSYMQDESKWQVMREWARYLGILQSLKACFIKYVQVACQPDEETIKLRVVGLQTELLTLEDQIEFVFETQMPLLHDPVNPTEPQELTSARWL